MSLSNDIPLSPFFTVPIIQGEIGVKLIQGHLPSYLKGTFYWSLPGPFSRLNVNYQNWVDGPANIGKLEILDSGLNFRLSEVNTKVNQLERESNQAKYRRFGTSFEGDTMEYFESNPNISIYPLKDKLLAFGEPGLPWALDKGTMKNLGEFNFENQLEKWAPFSGHPKWSPFDKSSFHFGLGYKESNPLLHLYRFSHDEEVIYKRAHSLDRNYYLHDCGMSEHFWIFHLSQYTLNKEALTKKGKSILESLSWDPSDTAVLKLIDSQTGTQAIDIPIEGGYCLHHSNAFEQDNILTVELIEYDAPYLDCLSTSIPFDKVPAGRFVRYLIDLEDFLILDKQVSTYHRAPDFPTVGHKKHQLPTEHCWALGISEQQNPGVKFYDELVHLKWGECVDIYKCERGYYLGGEPQVVYADSNRQASLICQLMRGPGESAGFGIWDAYHVEKGMSGVLELDQLVPFGIHSSYEAL